ncbi:hypothetical protein ZIOFF_012346 [Zingiber officinale]|uniref:Uncharacterized protein n=1 Tax=Zingiber officinale TaxID=94328 RepID=A0A8J5HKJ8_ZINOF|nr:hypothetical protein ZIOFF_012346 [Zingiber officinale]
MATRNRPVISERSITEAVEPVTSSQEDQIRSYRRMARIRYEAQRRFNNSRGSRTLESQLNPEAELELSQRQRASLVPAETLYSSNWSEPRHRVYQHYSETRILVVGGQQNLPLINQESYSILRAEGMQLIHLGLVMIRIHALHRRNAGVNALIVLRDTRWRDDRSIIGTMEVDLSGGTQLVYIAPNMLLSIEDFFNHIEIAIQTHGYEEWNTADSNLLITRGLIGRLTNTSYAGFRYNVQNVADYLASAGIHAVSATPRTISELQGMKWILQPPNASQTRNPQEVKTIPLMDGSIALSFNGYQGTRNYTPRRMSNFDTEGIQNDGEEEFAGVFIESEPEPTNKWEALGQPDTNPRWDTLGEPSGRYNFYVNYAAPPSAPFIPPSRPMWDDDDDKPSTETEIVAEAAFPSIWEDTPWEEDPYLDIYGFDEETHITDDDEEDLSAYFLGLENLENEYPISPNTVLPNEQQVNWEDSDSESEQYWQNTVEQVEQIEEQYFTAQTTEQMEELSLTESSSVNEDKTGEQDVTNEIAHAGIEAPLLEQLEGLEYPILRSMMNQALNENAFSSTSAISRYNPPPEPLMGQINYPPAQVNERTPQHPETAISGKFKPRGYNHQSWTLPSAQTNDGAILILPEDIGQYSEGTRLEKKGEVPF